MKKRVFLTGAISLLLVIGMVLIGCDNGTTSGSGGDIFAGTWEGSGTFSYFDVSGDFKLVAANGSFKMYLSNGYEANDLEIAHGPYTVAGNTAIATITQTLTWWSVGSIITNQNWENSGSTITAAITGNSFTTGGITFTKNPVTYTISGRISTIDGGGTLTSATVQLYQAIGESREWYPVGATVNPDINGYYTITGVPAGADYDIEVSLSGYGDQRTSFDVTGNVTGMNLILLKMVAKPTASPAAGEVASGTTITLTTATAGATIYYTTDGGFPNTQYSSPIPITTDVTIEAYAVKDGMAGSELLRAAYTIPDAPFTGTAPGLYIGAAAIPEANTATLTEALGWLRGNAASNTKYTILIGADTSLPPTTLGGDSSGPTVVANGKTGVKIILRGKDVERSIQLSQDGSLFTVKGGVTLVLDENITLVGRSSNYGPLVWVDSGSWVNGSFEQGSLVMRGNAKITGNESIGESGGVFVSGTFTMNDSASVSGNTASESSSYSDSSAGGGVFVSGTFIMNDNASVSNNTASASAAHASSSSSAYAYASSGGGVYVWDGAFTMHGNASISGNTASASAYASANTSGGGGVYVRGGAFTMHGGTIYGSDGGANANILGWGGINGGASLYDYSGGAKYGNGSSIVSFGTYTDATLTGH